MDEFNNNKKKKKGNLLTTSTRPPISFHSHIHSLTHTTHTFLHISSTFNKLIKKKVREQKKKQQLRYNPFFLY